ncbi:MAG: polysaccharide deacetylase family protein [Deltaproteobacteria bacterium]|nr:polysaccharide deacetylase family protein [Deltaproteobacteria bacterium]
MRSSLALLFVAGIVAGGCSSGAESEPSGVPTDDESAAWNAAYEENTDGKADTSGCSGVKVPDRSGFAKRIALTFDDGPNLTNTPIVLDALAKHNAKGTFFVNGGKLTSDAQKTLLKKMSDEGHFIGNHSHNHLNLGTQSAATVETQVSKTEELLKGWGITQRYFRFPFGSATCQGASIVRNHGYAITGWHIDSADWCFASGKGGVGHCDASVFKYVDNQYRDDMVGFIVSQAKSMGGGILLMHDIHSHSANSLDDVLTALENAGFSFVKLDDTSVFPLLNGAKPAATPFVGTVCKDDTACKFSSGGKDGSCYEFTPSGGSASGFCTLACDGYCPDKSGSAATFCTSLDGSTGSCVSKSAAENHECADIPGTAPKTADRYIGTSTASPATATVCLPK